MKDFFREEEGFEYRRQMTPPRCFSIKIKSAVDVHRNVNLLQKKKKEKLNGESSSEYFEVTF